MAASVQFRPNNRDLGMVMREVDENLAIFLGIRNGDKDKSGIPCLIEEDPHKFDISKDTEPKTGNLLMPKASHPQTIHQDVAHDIFLNLDIDKSDYDWLVTQCESAENQTEILNGETNSPKSELTNNTKKSAKRRPTEQQGPMTSKPSSKTTLASSTKPMPAQKRSSTPSKATTNISNNSKSGSRSSTPTRKPATLSAKSSSSDSDRSSSGRKTKPTMSKNPAPSRVASRTVKSKQSKPSECNDATQITKTSLPKRPASASRVRAGTQDLPRQKSCSPVKVRVSNGNPGKNKSTIMLSKSRGHSNGGDYDHDDVNPVLIGTKMVERVVNMRKLAPPKQDDSVSSYIDNLKKSSLDNSGFGRSLSKKSLDMAIRHMDIRRSIPGLSSYSACGIQHSSSKSSITNGVSSPLTSSIDSSKSEQWRQTPFL